MSREFRIWFCVGCGIFGSFLCLIGVLLQPYFYWCITLLLCACGVMGMGVLVAYTLPKDSQDGHSP